MTIQNKAKTRDELMNELADKGGQTYQRLNRSIASNYRVFSEGFKTGFQAADQNPPPEVQGLLDSLLSISKNSCCEQCQEAKLVASAAFETYRKTVSKE